jgi:cation transport ATPase
MYFATRAALSPMVAAILMPISSISIVSLSALLSYVYSKVLFKKN